MKRTNGFSLTELMITLAVLAIIVVIAVPSFRNSLERNRVTSTLQDFSSSTKYARSEAVKRSSSITMCASSDQSTCTGTWKQGWIIFKDIDSDGSFDVGTDTLLRVHEAITDGHVLTFDGANSDFITFSSRGYAAGQSGTFKLCTTDKKSFLTRGLILQATGSLRFTIDSDDNGVHEDATGTDLSC